ncbi:MAG: HNH endonuclease signature motif containing protein [bacterium]|nr:HNH endonuclease signature motif containing protein [bacterium]
MTRRGSLPAALRKRIIKRQRAAGEPYGLLCGYCSRPLRPDRPQSIHVDHIIPRWMAGERDPPFFSAAELDELWNLVATCRGCNESKNAARGAGTFAAWPPEACEFWLERSVVREQLETAGKRYDRRLAEWAEAAALRGCGTPAAFGDRVLCAVTGHLVGRGHEASCHERDRTSPGRVTVECDHR